MGGISTRRDVPRPKNEDDGVLRLLAAGVSLDMIANRLSFEYSRRPLGTRRDLEEILARAVTLVRAKSLFPPAEAAFREKNGVAASELDSVRSLSERLLKACIAESRDSSSLPDPKREQAHYKALRYAEALVRQDEILEALGRVDSMNAPLQHRLTGTDRKRLDEFLLYRNTKGRFETLDSLSDLWEACVARVEDDGGSYVHDEFVDRLTGRDSLEHALSLLSPAARETVEARVRRFDDRFVQATRGVSTSIRPYSPWRSQPWWWFRLPRNMGESFQARLTAVAPATAHEALSARNDAPKPAEDNQRLDHT